MLQDFKIDKISKLPYYYQVYEYLLGRIAKNELKEGIRLPSEMFLCKAFNVSRTTIRGALKELEIKGYITRGRGLGTFVSKNFVETHALQKVSSILDELKEKGIKTRSKILCQKIFKTSKVMIKKLEINEDIKVLFVKRLMMIDDEPFYITKAYFPNDVFNKIDEKYLEDLSLTILVSEVFKIDIIKKKRILEPDIPDNDTVKILEIKDSDKKVISRLETFWTFRQHGKARLIYFEEFFKVSKSKFIFES